MKSERTVRIVAWRLLVVVLAAAVFCVTADAQDGHDLIERHGDLVSIFSGNIVVPAGTRVVGSVICVGGDVKIEGEVAHDVTVILGSIDNRGTVGRAVTGVLTEQTHRNARVGRELVSVLGSLSLQNTEVRRELINILGPLERDGFSSAPSVNISLGRWFPEIRTLILWARLMRLLALFVLLLILAALVPERIRLIAEEAPVRYAAGFFVGVLGYLGMLVVLALLGLTVIGLPLAMVAFWIFKWLGVAGIFLAVGRGLGRSMNREMSLLGAILLTFTLYALLSLAPTPLGLPGLLLSTLLGTVFFFVVEIPAVGLVLLTMAGGKRREPPALSGPVVPVQPPSPAHVPPQPPAAEPTPPVRSGPPEPPREE